MKKIFFLFSLLPLALQAQFERPEDPVEAPVHRHTCTYQAEIAFWNIVRGNISQYLHDTIEYSQERRGKKYSKKYLASKRAERKLSHVLNKGNSIFSGRYNSGYIFSIIVFNPHEDGEILHTVKFKVDHFYQKIVSIEVSREFPTSN
jgi:hypothetical protein